MPPKLPPHVRRVRNRVGRDYYYFQRNRGTERAEAPQRLPDDPNSPEFWAEYARLSAHIHVLKPATDTVGHLIDAWQASPEWRQMSDNTRENWGRACVRIRAAIGGFAVKTIEPRHVLALRDQFSATPATASALLRCLSSMCTWSVLRGWRLDNPCREVKPLKGGEGYAPWSWNVIEAAEAELVAKRLDLWWAVALALYTGQRQGDVLAMRWDVMQGDVVLVRQEKTGKRLAVPLHANLAGVIATIPRRAVTILTDPDGRPWTADRFKGAWNRWKPQAVLKQGLVFHGLRKSAVVMLLEAGCTDAEVSAITGQSREMVVHYAKQVNQRRLAAAAILKWQNADRSR